MACRPPETPENETFDGTGTGWIQKKYKPFSTFGFCVAQPIITSKVI
jgi:hypothetical protein